MKTNFIIALTISLLYFVSCTQEASELQVYPEDSAVSDHNGTPIDSLSNYFPYTIKLKNKTVSTGIDTFNYYSINLHALKEKVLSNYYLGHDQYRFLFLRSFQPPIVVTLHREGDEVWINAKSLEKNLNIVPEFYAVYDSVTKRMEMIDSIIVDTEYSGNISYNETKQLTMYDWETFENLLQETGYWSMQPSEESFGLDGSRWIVEAHLKDKYWVVDRWSPENNFSRIGRYLVYRSGLKVDFY